MPKQLTKQDLKKAIDALKAHNSIIKASKALDIGRTTLHDRLQKAEKMGMFDFTNWSKNRFKNMAMDGKKRHEEGKQLRDLEDQIKRMQKELKVHEFIDTSDIKVPNWMCKTTKDHGLTGTPTLFLSDLHWGEYVDPDQIGGVNTYSMQIAKERLQQTVSTTVDLLKTYIAKPNYPGIVVALGGDLFSGDIHEELSETNEATTMESFLDLQGNLMRALTILADEFGHVFVPVVVGNHGRTSRKPRAKGAVKTNFDWLLGKQLELGLKHDKRITFRVSESLDTQYKIYGTRYNLTHGDQFSGGSGIAGILSPLMLGDHRKRKRQMAIGQPYDYMLCGHWHSLFNGRGLIINGSLKGYDEYAYRMNFQFEHPGQALWITHPEHDITYWMPVVLREAAKKKEDAWVSLPS